MYRHMYRQCPPGTSPYIIRAGDYLAAIAIRFNTTVAAIISANPGIVPENLYIGQSICIPQPQSQASTCPIGTSAYQIRSGDTLAAIALRFNTSVASILSANPGIVPENLYIGQVICISQEKPPEPPCPTLNYYVIRNGDTLAAIARAFQITVQQILTANPNINPNALYIGQVICLPVAPSPMSIVISTASKSLSVYRQGRLVKTYPVAIGKPSTPTPLGAFTIVNKQLNPGGPFGTRWMGLSQPHYGIHGTNNPSSIGTAASNGCIRMFNSDVEELFSMTGVGTEVRIY